MLTFPKAFFRRLTGAGIEESTQLGILTFEAARAMSRLVALHRSINHSSISVIRNTIAQSTGVAYLNYSVSDKDRVLQIACAEMLDELDQVGAIISRLSARCVSAWPREFKHLYAAIKSGSDGGFKQKLGIPAKGLEGKVKKMESYVVCATNLYSEMGVLSEMEASERRLEKWIDYSSPIPAGEGGNKERPPGADVFLKNIGLQRKLVRRLQDESVWSRNRDKILSLMGDAVVAMFLRICLVFGNHVAQLPAVKIDRNGKFKLFGKSTAWTGNMSGPLLSSKTGIEKNIDITKFSGPLWLGRPPIPPSKAESEIELTKWTAKTLSPNPASVGFAGLAIRYADIIVHCEKIFQSPKYCSADEREDLYRMLPESFRNILNEKLRRRRRRRSCTVDEVEKARRVLDWLSPMAHDTLKQLSENSYENHNVDSSTDGKVYRFQTLHNSDHDKTQIVIVDVLLGLCSLFQNQNINEDIRI